MPLILFLLWILLNGRVTSDVIVSGIAVAFLVCHFCRKHMGYYWRKDRIMLKRGGKLIRYMLVLIWEMILANIQVIRLVLSPKIEISPCIIHFQPPVKSTFARVLLANSITLTPGTITGIMTDKGYSVHGLTAEMAKSAEDSIFVKLARELEDEG